METEEYNKPIGATVKLKDFVRNLNELMSSRPETANFDVVTSIDDEGNGFNLIYFEPTVGNYNQNDREFSEEGVPNAVCVN